MAELRIDALACRFLTGPLGDFVQIQIVGNLYSWGSDVVSAVFVGTPALRPCCGDNRLHLVTPSGLSKLKHGRERQQFRHLYRA